MIVSYTWWNFCIIFIDICSNADQSSPRDGQIPTVCWGSSISRDDLMSVYHSYPKHQGYWYHISFARLLSAIYRFTDVIWYQTLIHCPMGDMAVISKVQFSNSLYRYKLLSGGISQNVTGDTSILVQGAVRRHYATISFNTTHQKHWSDLFPISWIYG